MRPATATNAALAATKRYGELGDFDMDIMAIANEMGMNSDGDSIGTGDIDSIGGSISDADEMELTDKAIQLDHDSEEMRTHPRLWREQCKVHGFGEEYEVLWRTSTSDKPKMPLLLDQFDSGNANANENGCDDDDDHDQNKKKKVSPRGRSARADQKWQQQGHQCGRGTMGPRNYNNHDNQVAQSCHILHTTYPLTFHLFTCTAFRG